MDSNKIVALYCAWIRAQYEYQQAIGRIHDTGTLERLHRLAGRTFEALKEYGWDALDKEAMATSEHGG